MVHLLRHIITLRTHASSLTSVPQLIVNLTFPSIHGLEVYFYDFMIIKNTTHFMMFNSPLWQDQMQQTTRQELTPVLKYLLQWTDLTGSKWLSLLTPNWAAQCFREKLVKKGCSHNATSQPNAKPQLQLQSLLETSLRLHSTGKKKKQQNKHLHWKEKYRQKLLAFYWNEVIQKLHKTKPGWM